MTGQENLDLNFVDFFEARHVIFVVVIVVVVVVL